MLEHILHGLPAHHYLIHRSRVDPVSGAENPLAHISLNVRLLVSNSVTVLCILLVHGAESVTDRGLRIVRLFGLEKLILRTLCKAVYLPKIWRLALVGLGVRLLDLAAVVRLRLGLLHLLEHLHRAHGGRQAARPGRPTPSERLRVDNEPSWPDVAKDVARAAPRGGSAEDVRS